jgi:hypothetical protein
VLRVEWWGWSEVSNESSLGGSEPGSSREGICFPSAPLGLPALSGHGRRDRGMEGVKGCGGGMLDAVERNGRA